MPALAATVMSPCLQTISSSTHVRLVCRESRSDGTYGQTARYCDVSMLTSLHETCSYASVCVCFGTGSPDVHWWHQSDALQGKPEAQLRALRTLAGMAKQRASAVPVRVVQNGFRELGAFPALMKLISDTMPSAAVRRSDLPSHAILHQ